MNRLILNASMILANFNMDPFANLKNNSISDSEVLRGLGMSFYQFMQTIGVIGVAATFMICGIQYLFARHGKKLQDVKDRIMIECVIGVVISGFVWIAGEIFEIAKTLV